MRPEGPRQNRLTPFKVLALILYGNLDCLSWTDPSNLTISLGPFARFLGMQNYRLRDYLKWLESNGYLTSASLSYNKARIKVALPPHLEQFNSTKVLNEQKAD